MSVYKPTREWINSSFHQFWMLHILNCLSAKSSSTVKFLLQNDDMLVWSGCCGFENKNLFKLFYSQHFHPSLPAVDWKKKTFYTNKLKKHHGNQCTFLHGGFKIAFSFKTYFHCLLLVLLLAACEHSLDFSSIIAWVICKGDIKNCIFLVFVGPSGGSK